MNGECTDVGIVSEDKGSAVSLVKVAVDDGDSPEEFLTLECADGDRYVVDEAEAFTVVGIGMVEATTEVHCPSTLEGESGGEHRASGGVEKGIVNFLVERGFGFQPAELGAFDHRAKPIEIISGVNQKEMVIGGWLGGENLLSREQTEFENTLVK